jgi:hypothetical protein
LGVTILPEYLSHYQEFDVLREKEHWDPHTREIVTKRLTTESFHSYRYMTQQEGDTLLRLCTFLLADNRLPVLSYVVHHFDSTFQAGIGEAQRKVGVPKMTTLILNGLAWLDQVSHERFGDNFISLEDQHQKEIVRQLVHGDTALHSRINPIPVKDWLDKILTEAVAAYYSHPTIWSEIGYAGPAYPRGYVRTEFGLTDPWEARRNGK